LPSPFNPAVIAGDIDKIWRKTSFIAYRPEFMSMAAIDPSPLQRLPELR
jgi:hypothetical protein